MKDKPLFAVVYMFLATAFFSSILILFAQATRGRVEANAQIALEKAILQVFPEIEFKSNAQVHEIFTAQFKSVKSQDDETILYAVYYKNDTIAGYAVGVEGQGFWAPIKGFVGVAADKKTITGVAFYEQSETPGLGARIAEPDFCGKFEGLAVGEVVKPVGIRPAGSELKNNEVHAITGATQTCVRLEKLINEGLSQWLKSQEGS